MKNGNINVLGAIGNTPLVQLTNLNGQAGVKIYAKLEGNNPGGSIKDRPAFYMIAMAEKSGKLTRDKTIIEPTSGNTGIAIAMIGAAKGYKVKLFMPECVSVERQLILQAFGAEVVLTPAKESVDGSIRRAHEALQNEPGKYFMPNQFDNPNNTLAHYETTGPEIYRQMKGKIDVFVCAIGTTGTLMGTGRYLREKIHGIKIVAVEPTLGHTIQGLKNMQESVVPAIFNPEICDEKLTVEDGIAFETTRLMAVREGLFTGMSSGAAVVGALETAKKMKKGNIVVILPDRGDRYLSTTLFRSICAKCPP
ncbi:MAG: PLP-dependent cysteine synthase family protein [Dehalococcoidales bacterium]|nr:PLP-dependent cysteine synthase family protein [Dehalococcoidales bacterium]